MLTKSLIPLLMCAWVPLAVADSRYDKSRDYRARYSVPPAATHAGQMDTDGILSQGELRNPNIDYERAQRWAQQHGDTRFNNQYNDRAAAEDRNYKIRDPNRYYGRDREWREHRDWHDRLHERRMNEPTWWDW